MSRSVLIAGLPGHLGSWLAERLPDSAVEVAFGHDEILHALQTPGWAVVVVDEGLDGTPDELARRVRALPHGADVRLIVTMEVGERGMDPARLQALIHGAGVDQVLFHPLDRVELLRHVAHGVGAAPTAEAAPASAPAAPTRERVSSAMDELWARTRNLVRERIDTVERAALAARSGTLRGDLRQAAEADAHRLAGSLGTFGVTEGSEGARELEEAFGSGRYLRPADGERLVAVVERVRAAASARDQHLPAQSAAGAPAAAAPGIGRELWVVNADGALTDAVWRAAEALQLTAVAATAADLRLPAAPVAVVVSLTPEPRESAGWAALSRCAEQLPGVPVVVVTDRDTLLDRVKALQMGARAFVQAPVEPDSLRDTLAPLLPVPNERRLRILAVDDDPQILAALGALLEPRGVEVHTAGDPLLFWGRLGEVEPDVAVLDVDMPHLNGIELCRVIRSDPRWRRLPVVFLTARTDRETVYRIFAAGADDYVSKPVIGPELLARIQNRVARTSV